MDFFELALQKEGILGTPLEALARSTFSQESASGRNTATSNAGARGPMQVLPGTFRGVADPDWNIDDPLANTRAGIRYLKQGWQLSSQDPTLTAAFYYGGPGGMRKLANGIAVRDPRNPNAPNTAQYANQVVSRAGLLNTGNNMAILNAPVEPNQPPMESVQYSSTNPALRNDPNAGILERIANSPGLADGLLQMGAGLLSQTGSATPLASGLSRGFAGFNQGFDQGLENSRPRVIPIGNGAFSQVVTPDGQVRIIKNPGVADYNMQVASNRVRPPPGYRYTQMGDLEVIPGGPVEAKNIKADEATDSKNKMAIATADSSISAIDDAFKILDGSNVLGVNTASGIVGQVTGGIGQTPAFNLKKAVETVKANVGFQQLQQMREASPTGGALGQVAVQELTFLQAAVASLDTAQSPEQLRANLAKVRLHFSNWKDTVTKANQGSNSANTGGDKVPPPGKVERGDDLPPVGSGKAPVTVKGDDDYSKLPSGTEFIGPDGKIRRKP